MGIVSYITKYGGGAYRITIPSEIMKKAHLAEKDMFIWNYDMKTDGFILELKRTNNES